MESLRRKKGVVQARRVFVRVFGSIATAAYLETFITASRNAGPDDFFYLSREQAEESIGITLDERFEAWKAFYHPNIIEEDLYRSDYYRINGAALQLLMDNVDRIVEEREAQLAYKGPARCINGRLTKDEWDAKRREVFARDGHACQYCGATHKTLACDHKVPVKRGGSDDIDNLITACVDCNRAKSNRTPEEWEGGRNWSRRQ